MPAFAEQASAIDPTGFALSDPSGDLTWAEVDDTLNRVANLLRAAGDDGALGPDRRVAVLAENAAEVALTHLGALLAGASSVPVNFHLTAAEAAYILEDSAARILFVGPETAERGIEAAAIARVPTVIGWQGAAHPAIVDWSTWLAEGSPAHPPTDIAPRPNLLYTSGTTGRPKGTELPPTMFAGGGDIDEHLAALAARPQASMGTHLVVGPMYHTGPLNGMRLLAAGVPSVILGRFDAESTLAAIDRHRVATSTMVPTHLVRLLALPAEVRARYDVSSIRSIGLTGSKLPVEVMAAMIDWFGPVFRDAYGATEVGVVCTISSEEWLEHRGSVGRTVPPFTAVVFDDAGNELGRGVEGQLWFRDATGRGIVYPNDPTKTAAANPEPGLFTLGEVGYVDNDGYVFITDRFSDMVVSGGVNLYPAEAEQVLIEHPAVADVVCIGVPHPEMGEELRALIVAEEPASPPDPGAIAAWLRSRLSHHKCPRSYEVVVDLERSMMGKVNKRRLRDRYLAGELTGRTERTTREGETMSAIAGLEVGLPDGPDAVDAAWMQAVLRTSAAIDDTTTVVSATTERFEAGGLLSALYRTALTYEGGDGPASVVSKFPIDIPHQRGMADGFGVYPKEVGWYRDIAPRSTIRTPKVHAAMINDDRSNYCVVMEDLGHLRQADRMVGMSWDEAIVAVDALASYHADWTGSSELERLSELFFGLDSPVYRMGLPGVAQAGWPAATAHASDIITAEAMALGDAWVDLLPTMIDHLLSNATLCHCDWRADNLFFDTDGELVVIDPQIAGVHNLAYDLGYFISQSLEAETYRGRIDELVGRYVATNAERGVELDADQVMVDTRVAVGLCLMYGFASFPEFEHLDPAGQDAQRTILRRAATAVSEFDALAAVQAL